MSRVATAGLRATCVAVAVAAITCVPGGALAAEATTPAPEPTAPEPTAPAPAAGSCTFPGDEPGPDVRYRYASRVNAWRARPVATSIMARTQPSASSARVTTLSTTTAHSRTLAWYLVLDARQVGDRCWLRVRLPALPNDRRGWVDRDELVVQRVRWQLEVDLSDRRVRLYAGPRVRYTARAVIGKPSTPTPLSPVGAPYALYDMAPGRANAFTGTWQLATTAYSPISETLGRIGLHGRGSASLSDPLGSAASHGCIRIDNGSINTIVRLIGTVNLMGVPFVIAR